MNSFQLERFPAQKNQPLQAWDAADEYLLSHLQEQQLLNSASKVLLINDSFGALAINLASHDVQSWSDSLLSHQACINNFINNQIPQSTQFIESIDSPHGELDMVLIKIPKTLALLEDQLIHLRVHCTPDTQIIAAGMIKHLPKTAIQLFEKIIGKTHTSLAKKKARLIFSQFEEKTPLKPPYPKCQHDNATKVELCQHANVFSKDKTDIGTRFFLEQFKKLPQKKHIIDLGCGNGLLGIMAQRQQPEAQLAFLDESYMAVASAEASYAKNFDKTDARFIASHSMAEFAGEADLILCNPPFHQQHSTGDFIAWQMFLDSQRKLNNEGELWVVGNRHLQYHSKLKKLFGNCKTIASNKKFVVLQAIKNQLLDSVLLRSV